MYDPYIFVHSGTSKGNTWNSYPPRTSYFFSKTALSWYYFYYFFNYYYLYEKLFGRSSCLARGRIPLLIDADYSYCNSGEKIPGVWVPLLVKNVEARRVRWYTRRIDDKARCRRLDALCVAYKFMLLVNKKRLVSRIIWKFAQFFFRTGRHFVFFFHGCSVSDVSCFEIRLRRTRTSAFRSITRAPRQCSNNW